MPVIPEASGARVTSMPEMSPAVAGAGYGALARASEMGVASADYGARVERLIADAQDHNKLMEAEVGIRSAKDNFLISLSMDGDHEAYNDKIDNLSKTLTDTYTEKYGDSPKVMGSIKPFLDGQIEETRKAANMKRVHLIGQESEARLFDLSQTYAQEISERPEDKDRIMGDYEANLQFAVKNLQITPLQAEKFKTKLSEDAEKVQVTNGLRSTDPKAIEQTIAAIDSHSFKTLEGANPEWLTNAKMSAEARLKTVAAKDEKQKDELAVNGSIAGLEQLPVNPDGSMDRTLIDKELHNPKFLADHHMTDENGNPDRKRIEEVRTYFDGRMADEEKQKKDALNKEDASVTSAIINRDFTKARDLLKKSKILQNDPKGLQLENAIRTWSKRTDEDINDHQDRQEYLRLNKMIDDEASPEKINQEIIKTDNLKSTTAFKLLDRLQSHLDKSVSYGLKTSNSFLKSQIAPSHGLLGASIPEEEKRAADAQQALQTWTLGEQKKATEGKRTPLTSQEIHDKAVEMAPQFQMKIDEKIDAMMPKTTAKENGPGIVDKVKGFFKSGGAAPAPITTKSGKQAWLWPDGQYHYSAPQAGK